METNGKSADFDQDESGSASSVYEDCLSTLEEVEPHASVSSRQPPSRILIDHSVSVQRSHFNL